MRIERTHDMELVKSILSHDRVVDKVTDDGCKEIAPKDEGSMWWLAVYVEDKVCGVFLVYPLNSVCYEMHTCLLPSIWGKKADQAAQKLLNYVFNEISAKKIVTNVPESNKLAYRYAVRNGMIVEGVNRESFLNNGVLENQIILGITVKEWELWQQSQH